MPTYTVCNDDHELVVRYRWPAQYVIGDGIADFLKRYRKAAVREREEFAALQSGVRDPSAAKLMKQWVRHQLRIEKAIALALAWFDGANTESPVRPVLWPVEMAAEMDEVARAVVLEFG